MRVIHRQAEQGHLVPQRVMEARGPFGRYEPKVVPLDIVEEFPPGATAQNEMREPVEEQMYQCRLCGGILREDELEDHAKQDCEGEV